MSRETQRTGVEALVNVVNRGNRAFPLCNFCDRPCRSGKLTCRKHDFAEQLAKDALAVVYLRSPVDAKTLPICAECQRPHYPVSAAINLCGNCMTQFLIGPQQSASLESAEAIYALGTVFSAPAALRGSVDE